MANWQWFEWDSEDCKSVLNWWTDSLVGIVAIQILKCLPSENRQLSPEYSFKKILNLDKWDTTLRFHDSIYGWLVCAWLWKDVMFMHISQSSYWHYSAKIEYSTIAACDSVFREMMYRCAELPDLLNSLTWLYMPML